MASDPNGFEAIYQGERDFLARSTARIAGDRAEDVVHDAFLTLLTYEGVVTHPRAWLGRVARNRALNGIRARREVVLDRDIRLDPDPAPAEREAIRQVVARALGDLDERSLVALRLRFFEERSYEDIADTLDVRVRQSHVVVHRALRRLGRAIVRRLAEAHDAGGCVPALEEIAGLGGRANGHGPDPCDRCRPVLDELAALRTLGLVPAAPAAGLLRRAAGEVVVRLPGADDLLARGANALTALAIGIGAVLVPQPTQAPPPSTPAAAVDAIRPEAGAPARVRATDEQRTPVTARSPRRSSTVTTPTTAEAGAVVVRGDERHTHGEINDPDGSTAGGVIVCRPLEPCPPPPGP